MPRGRRRLAPAGCRTLAARAGVHLSRRRSFGDAIPDAEDDLALRIWVDADAMPNDVKEIILRAARRRGVETTLVANKPVWIGEGDFVSFVHVTAGPDVADSYIVDASAPGDLCITAD